MLKSTCLVLIALTTSVVGVPAINSFGIQDNMPTNETQLFPPYTYVPPIGLRPQIRVSPWYFLTPD